MYVGARRAALSIAVVAAACGTIEETSFVRYEQRSIEPQLLPRVEEASRTWDTITVFGHGDTDVTYERARVGRTDDEVQVFRPGGAEVLATFMLDAVDRVRVISRREERR